MPNSLHAASLPFVTRALGGRHRARYAAIALVLALVSVALGAWVALGTGALERQLRVGLRLEQPLDEREREGFQLFAGDEYEAARLQRLIHEHGNPIALGGIARGELNIDDELDARVIASMRDGLLTLKRVRYSRSWALQQDKAPVEALLRYLDPEDLRQMGDWHHPMDESALARRTDHIVAQALRPAVVVYRSPLATADALRLTGLLAGGVTLLLLMICAPVLAGTQMAQEVHENTLQPLTGTALSARELVLGLSLGPAAVVAVLAAPQVVLLLVAAIAVGDVLPALAMLLVALVGGAFLTALAQLGGLALGRARSPGVLGVALLGVLAPLLMLGVVFGLELPRSALGLVALLPQAAAGHTLFEAFLPAGTALRAPGLGSPTLAAIDLSLAIGTLGMLVFAFLGLRALERRVGELAPAALRRWEALLGAGVSVGLILIANPWRIHSYDPAGFYLRNFMLVVVPLTILLMMRVPLGDTPPAQRRVPFVGLLGEFAAGVALYFAAVVACMGTEPLGMARSPVALAYLAWVVAVTGLLAIRVVALPMSLLAKVWAGVSALGVGVAFIHVVEWSRGARDLSRVFALWEVSPVLGVLQVVLLVLIPALLVRALRHPTDSASAPG